MDPLEAGDPQQVGAYRLVGRLGGGGMGRVYLGLSPGGRPVAVKVVRPELAGDPEFRARFAREVAAARQVGGFHTAPVVDADPGGRPPWMVTAYIAGPSLEAVVAGSGPLTLEAATALGAALAEGLAAIHACGLVHRDLKPANIIMADDGPRIIDFGIVTPVDASPLTSPGMLIGTVKFMSPEQMRGELAGTASDVFALGGVLAYAATGRAPFDGPTVPAIMHHILNREPDAGDRPDAPFWRVALGCLAKDPGQRPSAAQVMAALGGAAGPAAPLARREPQPPQGAQPPQESREPRTPGIPAGGKRHENITITQHANASPGSVVIQVAGNAKLGDDT